MRVFWESNRLQIEPDTRREKDLLLELVASLRVEAPPGEPDGAGKGVSDSGSDFLEFLGIQDVKRSPFASKAGNEQPVVGINVGLKVVPKLNSPSR